MVHRMYVFPQQIFCNKKKTVQKTWVFLCCNIWHKKKQLKKHEFFMPHHFHIKELFKRFVVFWTAHLFFGHKKIKVFNFPYEGLAQKKCTFAQMVARAGLNEWMNILTDQWDCNLLVDVIQYHHINKSKCIIVYVIQYCGRTPKSQEKWSKTIKLNDRWNMAKSCSTTRHATKSGHASPCK